MLFYIKDATHNPPEVKTPSKNSVSHHHPPPRSQTSTSTKGKENVWGGARISFPKLGRNWTEKIWGHSFSLSGVPRGARFRHPPSIKPWEGGGDVDFILLVTAIGFVSRYETFLRKNYQ